MQEPLQSPVSQDFVWVAEYADGTKLWEFDPLTKEEHSFWTIRKKDVIRFGLVGLGLKLHYEVGGGSFHVAGNVINLSYVINDQVYPLTGGMQLYQNLLTFKETTADFSNFNRTRAHSIHEYMFGYEENVKIGEAQATFRAMCHLPFQKPCYFTFQLTADQPLNGRLHIQKNWKTDEFDAELLPDETGLLRWTFTM